MDKISKINQTSSLHISQGIKLLKIPLVVSLLLEGTKVENRKCERRDICPALYILLLRKFTYQFCEIVKGIYDIEGFKSHCLNGNFSFYK